MLHSYIRELPDYNIQQVEQSEYQLPKHLYVNQTTKSLLGNLSAYNNVPWLGMLLLAISVVLLLKR